ncbi:sentrin-specific protease 1-like isoform X2 [Contarinia nasturtii]|uniref:sentrin-specific protease 1-like isoform X2 n=1 Tax=Contarinia nasturtii TaxID=265458 RepID=UPI0012D44CEF|nr:sentrin-specific protease 1-like isoform X2 [Contarinia nasturtii]
MDVMSRIRELLGKKTQKRKSSFEQIDNCKKIRMSELNGDDYEGDLHNIGSRIQYDTPASTRNHMRRSESFAQKNAKMGFLNSAMYSRSQTNDRSAPNFNYNYGNMDGKFKQPLAPLTNGSKKLPALLSASNCSLNFNKPQQTINPHFSKYGELSELSNFKSVPDLYPINRTNANASQSTSGGLLNGHEHSSMFLSSKYGSQLNPSSQSMLNNSNFGSTHSSILGNSKYFNNNSSTKPLGLKGSSLYSNSGQMIPPSNLSRSRYKSLLEMIPGFSYLKKSKNNAVNDSSAQGIIDLSDEQDVRENKTTNSSSSLPNVDRVNSLKTRLETKEVFGEKWETALNEKYSSKQLSRRDSLQQVQEENEECERKTRETEERLKESFKKITISSIIYDEEEEEEPVNDYPPLDDEKVRRVHQLISGRDSGTVLISKFNLSVTRHDIQTLQWNPLTWLNDEVINFYMELLAERSRNNDKLPKVHGMNTFFLKRLLENGYSGVRRWTRKVDIFAHDVIPVPVHKGIHWCMAIIHLKNKTIKYYDSMGAPNNQVLSALFEYLKAESLDKKKVDLDMTGWKTENVRNIPQQENGSDCGVFSCMYAEFVTRNRPIVFTQQHMQYFRMKMVHEICAGQMLN